MTTQSATSYLKAMVDRVVRDPLAWGETIAAAETDFSRLPGLRTEMAASAAKLATGAPPEVSRCDERGDPHDFVAACLLQRLFRRHCLVSGLSALERSLGRKGKLRRALLGIWIDRATDLAGLDSARVADRYFVWCTLGWAYSQFPFGPRSALRIEAIRCFRRAARTLRRDPADRLDRARIHLGIGTVFKEHVDLKRQRAARRSLFHLKRARSLVQAAAADAGNYDAEAAALAGDVAEALANVFRDLPAGPEIVENVRHAVSFYREALAFRSRQDMGPTLRNLAEAIIALEALGEGDLDVAVNYLERALHSNGGEVCEEMGLTELALGRALIARHRGIDSPDLTDAEARIECADRIFARLELTPMRVYTLFHRGQLKFAHGRFNAAEELFREAASQVDADYRQNDDEEHRRSWLTVHSQVYEALLATQAELAAHPSESESLHWAAAANETAESTRARNLVRRIREGIRMPGSNLPPAQTVVRQIMNAVPRRGGRREAVEYDSADELHVTRDELVRAAERCGAAMLSLRITQWGTCATVVTPDGRWGARRFPSPSASELRTLWRQWYVDYERYRLDSVIRNAEQARLEWSRSIETAMRRLGAMLGSPLHEFLRDYWPASEDPDDPKPLVVIPGQGFNLWPLHAMNWDIDGRSTFADDGYLYAYAPAIRALAYRLDRSSPRLVGDDRPLLVRNPTGDRNLKPFDGLCRSLQSSCWPQAKVLHGNHLVGHDVANLERLKGTGRSQGDGALGGHRRVLFATHGCCDFVDPYSGSYLELAKPIDGDHRKAAPQRLTLADVLELDLSAVDLVALCACESGIPEPNDSTGEQLGLPAGFLCRGVRSVVAGMWRVQAGYSALIMHEFFQLLHAGDTAKTSAGDPWKQAKLFRAARRGLTRMDTNDLREKLSILTGGDVQPPAEWKRTSPYLWAPFCWFGIG